MLAADLAQPLEIAARRHDPAGGTLYRLDDYRGNSGSVVQCHQPLQLIGQVQAPLRQAAAEAHVGGRVGMRQVIDPGHHHRGEHPAIVADAPDRDPAQPDPVIAALTADHPGTAGLAAHAVIADRNLKRGIDRLGAGIDEEHPIVRPSPEGGNARGEFERRLMAQLEARAVVEPLHLVADRAHDSRMRVTQWRAPHPRQAIEHALLADQRVVRAGGAFDQARLRLETAVVGEWHPP